MPKNLNNTPNQSDEMTSDATTEAAGVGEIPGDDAPTNLTPDVTPAAAESDTEKASEPEPEMVETPPAAASSVGSTVAPSDGPIVPGVPGVDCEGGNIVVGMPGLVAVGDPSQFQPFVTVCGPGNYFDQTSAYVIPGLGSIVKTVVRLGDTVNVALTFVPGAESVSTDTNGVKHLTR